MFRTNSFRSSSSVKASHGTAKSLLPTRSCVGESLVIEVHRILRGQNDPEAEGARLF
jgi:hypothetical protein